jgi:hypothetical protein
MALPLGEEEPLMGAGLTSLGAVRLQESLAAAVGSMLREPLPATLAFDYPTPGALRAYVLRSLVVPAAATNRPPALVMAGLGGALHPTTAIAPGWNAAKLSTLDRRGDGAAIVGVDGVFPSGGGGLSAASLEGGGNAVDAIGRVVQIAIDQNLC